MERKFEDVKIYSIVWVDVDLNNKNGVLSGVLSGVCGSFYDIKIAKQWLREQYEIEKNNTDIDFETTLTDNELTIEYEIDGVNYVKYTIQENTLRKEVQATGKLRVWNGINFTKINYYEVDTIEQAIFLINSLIKQQLTDEDITDNAFGLEEFDEDMIDDECDGWTEYYNDEGLDIMEIIDERETELE